VTHIVLWLKPALAEDPLPGLLPLYHGRVPKVRVPYNSKLGSALWAPVHVKCFCIQPIMPRINNSRRNRNRRRPPRRNQRRRANANRYTQSGDFTTQRPREEVKQFTVSNFNTSYYSGTAGQVVIDVTAVTQGISGAQRAGDHLFARHLRFTYSIFNGIGATANGSTYTRIFFVQYKGDSSVAGKPTIADFLQVSVANSGNTYGTFSSYDIDYDRQYVMLWDSGPILTYGTNGMAATADCANNHRRGNRVISLRQADRNIAFYTGGTTGPNKIFMIITSDSPTIATNPAFTYNVEFRFTDS
jgi:hypothetical protein